MAVPRTNHPALQTDCSAEASREVGRSGLDIAVLVTESKKEALSVFNLSTERSNAPELQTVGPDIIFEQTSNASLEIVVLHTKPSETLSALKMAAELASGLAPVRLLVAQVVPYPLDLYAPPVTVEFLESSCAQIVSQADVNASVDIRLGRDAGDVMEAGVGPHSVVIIGGRRGWWPTATMRLARRLERLGHQVVFTN